jgi:hypothetical protein
MDFPGGLSRVLGAVAIFVVLGLVSCSAGPPGRERPAGSTRSCVYTDHSLAKLAAFERSAGQPVNCVLVFNDAVNTWDALTSPWFIGTGNTDHAWGSWASTDPGRVLVIGQGLVPTNSPPDWRSRGAAGEYDEHFRVLGERLVAAGLGSSIIRLGHEANGTWFFGNIGGNAPDWRNWAVYWARVAKILHDTPGAHFRLDWTVSSGPRAIALDAWYPGDAAVDLIGIDQYDTAPAWVGQEPLARWTYQRTQPGGPESVVAFARRHGKPLSVPEWGPLPNDSYGAGDNAFYVSRMLDFFRQEDVVYEGFWNKTRDPSKTTADLAPQAFASYRSWLAGPAAN